MKVLAVVLGLCFLVSVPAGAQTNPVPAGQPFTVGFDHAGTNVTGFQCYADGKPSGAVLAVAARSCVIPGQTAGVHTVAVEARNAFGSTKSPDLTVTAGTAPASPTNLRVTVDVAINENGSLSLIAASVTRP
jgi:hypothetical protein